MGNRYQFTTSRKPGPLSGVGSSFGALLGKTANIAGNLPGQIVSGVANGYRSGAQGFNQVRKLESCYQLIQTIGANLTEAKSVADQISETIKQVIICSDSEQAREAKKNQDDTVWSLKKSFQDTFGISYETFVAQINNFTSEQDFMSTAGELYSVAKQDLAEERRELDDAKSNAFKDIEAAETDLNDREANLDAIAGQFKSTGIFSGLKERVLGKAHSAG